MYNKISDFYKKKNKSGAIIIYVVFLLTISLILATIVFDSFILLKNEGEISNIESEMYLNMNEKFILASKLSDYYNNNGSGFIDNIGCPTVFSMSGNTSSSIISSVMTSSGGIVYCSGDYLGNELKIFFRDDYTDLSGALYKGSLINLAIGTQVGTFGDTDSTIIDITGSPYIFPDLIDDNMNSDNFLVSSTGITNYPNGFYDDDIISRIVLNGFIKSGQFRNIFWNSTDVGKYIDDNANNYDTLNIRLSQVSTGVLFLEINTGSILHLLEIDRNVYDVTGQISFQNTFSGAILAGSGYIQNNIGVLSLSPIKTGNEYIFNFKNKDYGLFINNTGSGVVKYNLRGETDSGTGIYIVPFNDTSNSELSFLGNDIIKNNGIYIGKTQELKKYLKFGNGAGSSFVLESYTSGLKTGRRWSDGSFSSTCNEYRYPLNPTTYKYLGNIGDGYYWLNPGGVGFIAYCDMTGGGWTVAKILSWLSQDPLVTPASGSGTDKIYVVGIDTTTLLASFTYDLTSSQISALKAKSTQFSQFFKKKCYRSIVYSAGSTAQVMWKTFGSALIPGVYFPNYAICDSHNNDPILPETWFESSGYSSSGALLPITEIHGGDTQSKSLGVFTEDSYYQFGDFYMR